MKHFFTKCSWQFANSHSQTVTNFLIPVAKFSTFVLSFIFVLCFFISCTKPIADNEIIRFNSDWKFFFGDDSMAFCKDYNDTNWRTLNLPHDWSIEGEFSEDHPTKPAGGALPAGIGWYRKHFTLSPADSTKNIFIHFDGIYRNSEVWINDHYLGKRANGYVAFRYNLTPYLNFNGSENVLVVKADNSLQPNSRWYTGSGIYRNVWLVKNNDIYIENWGVTISTPKITEHAATISLSTQLAGEFDTAENIIITTSIINPKGKTLIQSIKQIPAKSAQQPIHSNIELKNPELWSVATPNLYKAQIEIASNNIPVHTETHTFGIRDFHFDADSGFFLNGKHMIIQGVNLHHDLGALGAAVNIRAMERQLEIMRGMGVNAIRTAHNPPAPEFLDLCDRMGFLVMDEAFDVWQKKKMDYDYNIDWEENYKKDLQDLILRDRNHPSVIIWSIGNEIREQFDSTGTTIARELVNIVKAIDTTRPVTCALTETDPEKNFIYQSKALDILGFNYKHADWAKFKENFPGEKMIATENMSAYATRGTYNMPSDTTLYWPRKHNEPIINPNPDYTVSAYDMVCAYWGATHETTMKAFYQYDFIAGMFIWCGIDFIGEPVPYEWPAKSSYYGVVDLAGFPKDVYYLYQSIWTNTPTLHVFPHWTWKEGDTIDVWAYYNHADEVELFVNGNSKGIRSKENDDMHVMWRIPFEAGTLKAISRKNGTSILEKEIHTAGDAMKIKLVADRSTINANNTDLSFITVKVLDETGNMVPDANNLINFEIEGEGFIAGVDNGYQASHEPFKAEYRKAFNGMCLAIVQSNGNKGDIKLTATSEGLQSAELIITAK